MTDETTHIATAAAVLDDPYAALLQHLHGDGDTPTSPDATGKEVMPDASTRPIQQPDTSPRLTAGAHHACATPGCTNPPVIRLDDRRLCRGCYATHDFGDDA